MSVYFPSTSEVVKQRAAARAIDLDASYEALQREIRLPQSSRPYLRLLASMGLKQGGPAPRRFSVSDRRIYDVLDSAAGGRGERDTAEALHLSPWTVKSYRRDAYRKLGAKNVTHAVAIAIRRGLL